MQAVARRDTSLHRTLRPIAGELLTLGRNRREVQVAELMQQTWGVRHAGTLQVRLR